MSVSFANGRCFVLTQNGASNCTEFNYRTRREVLEKNWNTTRYCTDTKGAYLNRPNHFCNAITRYNVSADKFMDKFKSLSVYVWDVKSDVRLTLLTLHTVDDLYNLFMKYPDKQFSFDIPRDFSVSAFTARINTPTEKTGTMYYVYNLFDNGIYCRQHRKKQLTVCCFDSRQPFNCKFLNNELEQYLLNNFGIKSVLLFKSIPACVRFFLDRNFERLSDVYIGVYGQENTPSIETKLETYLKKSIDYNG